MIRIHDTYEYMAEYTQHDVELFSELTGDKNPLNLNKAFAEASEYGHQIVPGMLIAASFSKVFGTLWPADDSIYISQEMLFLHPVYVGGKYPIKFVCDDIDRERSIGTISAVMKDANGKEVIKVKAKIKSQKHFSNPQLD